MLLTMLLILYFINFIKDNIEKKCNCENVKIAK